MEPEIDKIRLLELMRAEYAFFERTLALLKPDDMLVPNVIGWWSVKDTVAHVTAWMEDVVRWFDQASHGEPVEIPPDGYSDEVVNRINDERSARDKDKPLTAVLSSFRTAHLEVCELVESQYEHDLFDSDWDGLFIGAPWRLVVGNTYDHLHEHVIPIRQWIAARAHPAG